MKRELVIKNDWKENKAKLTVSLNRISVKLSEKTLPDKKLKQVIFFNKIILDLINVKKITNTFRGQLFEIDNKFKITMYDNNKRNSHIY